MQPFNNYAPGCTRAASPPGQFFSTKMGAHYPSKPSHHAAAVAANAQPNLAPRRDLSDQESEQVAQRREAFLSLLPDAYPFFKALYAEGLIDGWRSVTMVSELPSREPEPDFAFPSDDLPPDMPA